MSNVKYAAFHDKVRAWSNRDREALSDIVIDTAIQYSADKAYHQLFIPAFEHTITYSALESSDLERAKGSFVGLTEVTLPIPADLTKFIHLRETTRGRVFNEKTDVRTGYDMLATKTSDAFWYRHGSEIKAVADHGVGDILELHYFRRQSNIQARYILNQANIDADNVLYRSTGVPGIGDVEITTDSPTPYFLKGDAIREDTEPTTGFWEVLEVPSWLRDENERILLFGALAECGHFLMDTEMVQLNSTRFIAEIGELNNEEGMRKASGGNVQVNYTSYLI